jgi:hypothetical protein
MRVSEMLEKLTIRARVAFVLGVADRVMLNLIEHSTAFDAGSKAISAGWRWVEGGSISANELYDNHVENLAIQSSMIDNPALGTVISALYYVMWHAFKQEINDGKAPIVPNDIAEVSEEVVDEVCDYATKAKNCDDVWIISVIRRMTKDYTAVQKGEMGSTITRKYFTC